MAGRVRMKSPIAPPRIIKMRLNELLRKIRVLVRTGFTRHPSVMRRRHRPEWPPQKETQSLKESANAHRSRAAPLKSDPRKQIRHRHPEEPGHDHQVGEHRDQQSARLPDAETLHRAAARPRADRESRARGPREIHRRIAGQERIRSEGQKGAAAENSENSPISMVARSQKLQIKSIVRRSTPATRGAREIAEENFARRQKKREQAEQQRESLP